jgi:hypothetical protein
MNSTRAALNRSRAASLQQADQQSDANVRSSSLSQALNKQYQALENLSQYNANQLVMRLNVTANNQNAVLRIFTGNNANNVTANNDFAQNFAGCGIGGAGVIVPTKLAPVAPAVLDEADVAPLGDHLAKPE